MPKQPASAGVVPKGARPGGFPLQNFPAGFPWGDGGHAATWGDPNAGFLGNYMWEAPPPPPLPVPKPRKPPVQAKRQYASVEGRWTELEHSKFLEGLHAYGRQVSTCD